MSPLNKPLVPWTPRNTFNPRPSGQFGSVVSKWQNTDSASLPKPRPRVSSRAINACRVRLWVRICSIRSICCEVNIASGSKRLCGNSRNTCTAAVWVKSGKCCNSPFTRLSASLACGAVREKAMPGCWGSRLARGRSSCSAWNSACCWRSISATSCLRRCSRRSVKARSRTWSPRLPSVLSVFRRSCSLSNAARSVRLPLAVSSAKGT
ncbi:hypothetical protein D3C76_733320 [compost metagenome]